MVLFDIEGLVLTPLREIKDDRGAVLHMLRSDSTEFKQFGECYFSELRQNQIKAWKSHKIQTQNICVPVGEVKIVFYDDRIGSKSCGKIDSIILSRSNYNLLTIPPGIWYGFQSLFSETSLIANCVDIPHDPEESLKKDMNDNYFPFNW